MDNILKVSPSPHQHADESTRKLMLGVIIALMPALAASIYFFGTGAIIVTLTSVLTCVIVEYVMSKFVLDKKPSISDGSAIVTGLLLAFNLPSNLTVFIVIIGGIVAIAIAKMTFGGLGNNPFNPAIVGRIFLLISFPVQMTTWPIPSGFHTGYADAVSGATPLGIISEGLKNGEMMPQLMDKIPSHMMMFFGYMGGSMGEISALALILGGIYLLWKKIITWHIPVSILLTVIVFSGILWMTDSSKFADPVFHLLTGGLLLGAIFMATDYVTSPMSHKGMIIYGIGIGIITLLIRNWGAYPEGVSFAILIMNAFTPLINKYIKPSRFGKEAING
jgi:Na+-translocating ferredoxin:NAD+ oxidoreductase subunit D